ncbi:hypothetical protein DL766_009765 [Monosporascus sp. MC13-8B]|uniref:gamma-glutamylcyclotransferase n=1 Tax=Monosporascus cannonballus TaxID=155416 RepID=A0ABY0H0N9_9PEZI|nr:hypothetical protein DL762_007200 [Monosporascus cannonballus]RYO84567.1 hypothetical protein DL763_007419 [Monosporascus cannonballus]RYP14084.1 hypothetical protein DL766_009765 [Monosporascus sp. MC13-8B]
MGTKKCGKAIKKGDKATEEILYFAYGSNLSPTQMQYRCPNSPPVALAHLPGWMWLINERGYANIVQVDRKPLQPQEGPVSAVSTADHGIYGVLYKLDSEDEAMLDVYEGVPWAYEKCYLEATKFTGESLADGERVKALVYVDFRRVSPSNPTPEYMWQHLLLLGSIGYIAMPGSRIPGLRPVIDEDQVWLA